MNQVTQDTIRVSGDEAMSFLQGQLSNDIGRLNNEKTIRAAWCTPKGRVITLLSLSRSSAGYDLEVPAELSEDIVKRLTMYRFRAKVDFEILTGTANIDLEESVKRGIPFIGVEQTEKFTPHMLNLDLIDAISLDKGCYTGQEIVARTHYKGATKRRTLRFDSAGRAQVGDRISDGSRDIGEVLNAAGNALLAVIPSDKADSPLTINGEPISHRPLDYL